MTIAREIKRKGFTLVELLAVILVIGILAAMIMLASDEIVSSAQAARILENLTNWKKATLAWYADHVSVVLYNGMIDKNVGSAFGLRQRPAGDIRPSGFREDTGGMSSFGVVTAKNILPYVSISGLTLTKDGRVIDGYGGQYLTDYATLNEYGTASSNDHYINGNPDEYIWMIDYRLPNMSEKLRQKLNRKYINPQLLGWKYPGKSLQYSSEASEKLNSVGILVLDFSLLNDTRY